MESIGELTSRATTARMKSRSGRPAKCALPRKAIKNASFGVSATEKGELVIPTSRTPQRRGTSASSTKRYSKRRGELSSAASSPISAELPMATTRASQSDLVGTSSTEVEPAQKAKLLFAATPSVEANSRQRSASDRDGVLRGQIFARRVVNPSRNAALALRSGAEVVFVTRADRAWYVAGGAR